MAQVIDFIKCSPTQNMTILVRTDHPAEDYTRIATRIMSYDSVYAEQVGFIGKPVNKEAAAHLQMAGGEFCGNACMALAALIASEHVLEPLEWTEVVLETSGTDYLVKCLVKKNAELYDCQVSMPVPRQIELRSIHYEGSELEIVIVRYRDFIHIVMEAEQFTESERRRAQSLARLLGVTLGASLIGILLYNPASEEMAPLIYVPSLDSMVWERGCGSGTASIGAYLAWKSGGTIAAHIKQPGGTIQVTADYPQGHIVNITIQGSVAIVAQGKAFLHN
ncbi:diaminopimelate epimerase [Paenibacillus tarimensis]|uniref:diaminopimelate epimerase n=1 Tax=Paenibacillus tarimensis TaxID=416012 RepID=UPI001F42B5D8|nr:diaminopimelate epimerase [Paenibacillus tarimensis]MCF2945506.1 diaminopimelate epimerase [Paenibacillus tarimensis]